MLPTSMGKRRRFIYYVCMYVLIYESETQESDVVIKKIENLPIQPLAPGEKVAKAAL